MFKNCSALLLVIWLAASPVAMGQAVFEDGEFKPFEELHLGKDADARILQNRVLYFAHFTCPYCRQAHEYLHTWGDQLPQPYAFEVVPAVGLKEHMPMAAAFYVVLQVAPQRLRRFEHELFAELQDRGGAINDPDAYLAAAKRVGVDEETFRRVLNQRETEKFVERAFALTQRYKVNEVPTVVVANRFKTAPGRVYNDQQAFISVLNGLMSMAFEERFSQ